MAEDSKNYLGAGKKYYGEEDVYLVVGENGGYEGTVTYPKGGSLYENARRNINAGTDNYVYKTNKEGDEIYTPVSEAKATTTIDPVTGTITVTGPKWLTSQIVNSDSFKKNYSENSALLGLVNLFRNDPTATITDPTTGNPIKVTDAIKTFQDSMENYSNTFAAIEQFKKNTASKYGVNFTDENVYIANNFHNKDDYNKSGVIYVPDWAKDMYDWGGLDSWDEKNGTVSAEDFFTKAYAQDFDNPTAKKLQDEALSRMEGFLNYNVYDPSDEEDAKARQEVMGDESYASELARTMQMYSIVSQNKPETSAMFDIAMFSASAISNFIGDLGNAGYNISKTITGAFEGVADFALDAMGVDEDDRGGLSFIFLANPAYLGGFILGETMNFVRDGGDLGKFMNDLQADTDAMWQGKLADQFVAQRDELNALFDEFNARNAMLTGAWSSGEVVGHIAYKIAENIVLLNTVGGLIGKGIAGIGTTGSGIASFMAKAMSDKAVVNVFKTLGFAGNVVAQGFLETFIDDGQLLDKAIASGEMTPELWDKVKSNVIWNAVGEASGFGASKGITWVLSNTTPGKAISVAATKGTAKIAKYKYAGLHKFFTWLNKGNWSETVGATAEGSGKVIAEAGALGKFNTSMYAVLSEAADTISKIPIFKELDEASYEAINNAWEIVFGDKNVLKLVSEETAEDTAETIEKTASEVSEDTAKASEASVSETINKNYEAQRKAVMMRMNLENQIDAINKGVSIKMSEINTFAGDSYTEYAEAQNKVAMLEQRNKKLTFREGGSIATKESSEYLSYKMQITRYSNRIKQVEDLMATGMSKGKAVATAHMGNIENYNKSVEYLAAMQKKMGELSQQLGGELKAALDDLFPKMARYNQAIDDYMMVHGYYTKEQAKQIMDWRASGVFGENGNEFIHTARLFEGKEVEDGVKTFVHELENPAAFATKMVAEDSQFLKPGNINDSFVDPNMVLYGRLRASAAVAQGQEMGRALNAISLPTRQLKGFNLDGTSQYEAQIITKNLKELQKDFGSAFDAKNGKILGDAVKEAFVEGNLMKEGISKVRMSAGAQADAEVKTVEKEMSETQKRITKLLDKNKTAQNAYVDGMDDAALNGLLLAAPDGTNVPVFNMSGLKANSFNDWYNGLPPKAQSIVKSKIKGQGVDVSDLGTRVRGNTEFINTLKKVSKADPEFAPNLKRAYIKSDAGKAIRDTEQYQNFIRSRAEADLSATQKTLLASDQKKYAFLQEKLAKAQAKADGLKVDFKDYKTFGEDFVAQIKETSSSVIEKMASTLKNNETFQGLVKRLEEAGVETADAERYVILQQLSSMKKGSFSAALLKSSGDKYSIAQNLARKSYGKALGDKYFTDLSKTIGSGLEEEIGSEFRRLSGQLSKIVPSDTLDMESYWNAIEKEMNDIEAMGIRSRNGKLYLDDIKGKRHVVQLVDNDGVMRFYETDPLYAELTNWQPSYFTDSTNRIADAILNFNSNSSALFRWGTTGIDIPSYINQWFRDPINAIIVGGAKPFTDLGTGGFKSFAASVASDSIPFGQKFFGKYATTQITQEVIDSTFETTEAGLKAAYGADWLDGLKTSATKGMTGEAANAAYKRAVVEFAVGESGYEALPGLGGITEAQFYRATESGNALSSTTLKEVRKEEYEIALNKGLSKEEQKQFARQYSRMRQGFDNFFENTSRGNWRESFLRKSVYTSQYKNAVESGMSMQEAKVWATRYALDATTDFGRSFAFGNRFIKSVPYLGAAINGQKSFIRLLELDPAGVTARLSFGLILPYMGFLSESLSDPANREVYKNIKEYEKEDSAIFVYKGSKIQIPIPQELSGFLAPFRHFVEKAADAQDASWLNLVTSDALGLFPLDLSGFADLDANDLLTDDQDTGIWSHISRGVEKAASSLMPPSVKSAYMLMSGRDPYTGREIDTSYVVITEDGEEIMDSTKSGIAKWLSETTAKWGWNLTASAAQKVLQNFLGRSTLSVLDGAVGTLSGGVDMEAFAEEMAEQVSKPVDGGSDYNEARSNWTNAINLAYAKREELINDDGLQKALAVMRDENWDTYNAEKRQAAFQTYKTKMDEYAKFVLDIAKNMKEKYPDQYTSTRVAQIVSLLTMPTGVNYNDTDYSQELQKDSYYDSRNAAINTLLRMGFPLETSDVSILGQGYYDKYGQYQFKVNTPYEIQYLQSAKYGTTDQFQSMIKEALKAADIKSGTMWEGYYKAKDKGKAALKEYQSAWNAQVVKALYPIISRYGANSVLNDSATRDLLEDYIFVSNPYKKKQYLYQIFGGNQ